MANYKTDHAFTGDIKGGALEPTFSGALSFMRRRFTRDLSGIDVAIWGVPFDCATSNRPGARFGPQAIRRASTILDGDPQYPSGKDPFESLAVVDWGDCVIDHARPQGVAQTIQSQAESILSSGTHLITLGGDHAITLPLLQAHARKHGPLALVQFDAHQDTWDPGPDGFSHGSFVREAVREGLIDVPHSIQIGIRTIAPETCGVEIIDAYRCQEIGVSGLIDSIKQRVGSKPAYLTVDIDVLDPAFAPGTGTPVSGGLSSAQLLMTLNKIIDLDWRGMDIVEVAPAYDHADITAIAASTVVQHYLQGLSQRHK
ncbi:MAG: agmatinase [Alphaproteobacteria bacterium]